MILVSKRNWEVHDGSKASGNDDAIVPPGRHEIERVPNPFGFEAPWLVLKGTLIGATEGFWRQWTDYSDDFQIVIEE